MTKARSLWLLSIVALAMCFESWFLGPYSYIPRHDTGDGQVPAYAQFVKTSFTFGSSGWYPYHLGGVDEAATYNLYSFISPFYAYLPLWLAFAIVLFIQHLLAASGGWLFARRILKFSPGLCLLFGVAYTSPMVLPFFYSEANQFGWNNYFEFRLGFGFFTPAMPLFLVWFSRLARQRVGLRTLAEGFLLGLVASLSMFFVAFYPYMMLAFALFAWFWIKGRMLDKLSVLLAVGIGSIGPHLPAMAAAKRLYPYSHRALADQIIPTAAGMKHALAENSIWRRVLAVCWEFVRTLFGYANNLIYHPFLPQMIVFLIVSVVAFFVLRNHGARRRIFVLRTSLILASFCVFPLLNTLNQFVAIAAESFSGGSLFKRIDLNYVWGLGIKFAAILMVCASVQTVGRLWPRVRAVALALGFLSVLIPAFKYRQINLSHLLVNGSAEANYNSPQLREFVARTQKLEPFRVLTMDGSSGLVPNYLNVLGVETLGGHDNLYSGRIAGFFIELLEPQLPEYFESLIRPHVDIKTFAEWKPFIGNKAFVNQMNTVLEKNLNVDLLRVANVRFLFSEREITSPQLTAFMTDFESPLSTGAQRSAQVLKGLAKLSRWPVIRYLFFEDLKFNLSRVDVLMANVTGRSYKIYELQNPWPRSFVADAAEAVPSQATERISGGLRASVLKLEAESVEVTKCDGAKKSSRVTWLERRPDFVRLEVEASCRGWLYLSQTHSPYWTASVNGLATPVLAAFGAFSAIGIPAGRAEVEFKYDRRAALDRTGGESALTKGRL